MCAPITTTTRRILRIDINRDRAATYGVSTSAIQSLLRNAYSQNYVYLIKQPDDQYQVILEVKDKDRAHPRTWTIFTCVAAPSGNFSASGSRRRNHSDDHR